MNGELKEKLNQHARTRKGKRKWLTVVSGLCAAVALGTFCLLINPAATQKKETFCGIEEHKEHTDACFEKTLVCRLPEEGHTHSEACYDPEMYLSCEIGETDGHQHGEDCYETERVLVCDDESEEHVHTDECYEERTNLICQLDECEPHHHDAACYSVRRTLICQEEEGALHQHGDSCYEPRMVCTCGMEECGPHEHGEECYEINYDQLICELPIHEHTLQCFSDPNADIETAEIWERSFENVALTGNWNKDVLAIAKTQIGYRGSTENYVVQKDGTTIKGITRYGQWYGIPYGDWCAMFCSFCLNYAGVDNSLMPFEAGCQTWVDELSSAGYGLYYAAGTDTPVPGDLIFFDWDAFDPEHLENRRADHIGFVADLITDKDTNEVTRIVTIEGNYSNDVRYCTYNKNDEIIMGFAHLPKNPSAPAEKPSLEIPECTCYGGSQPLISHGDNCELKKFAKTLADDKTADEVYAVWDQLSDDMQSFVLNYMSWNYNNQPKLAKLQQLIAEGGREEDPGEDEEGGLDIPACSCINPPQELKYHSDACPRKAYAKTLSKEKTAGEITAIWLDLPEDIQDMILFALGNEQPAKHEELQELIEHLPKQKELEPVSLDGLAFKLFGKFPDGAVPSVSSVSDSALAGLRALIVDTDKHLLSGAYDISVFDAKNNKLELQDPVEVVISGLDMGNVPYGALRATVYHFVGLGAEQLESGEPLTDIEVETLDAFIDGNGNLIFTTDSFSVFYFTVDFHNGALTFSIEGGTSILLSELFEELGLGYDVADVVSVSFSDDSLVSVEGVIGETGAYDDWILVSKAPFDTEEYLTITFADGMVLELLVTDAQSADYTTTATTNVTVDLNWTNGTAPTDQVVVNLCRDGVATGQSITLTAANGWRGQFTNLPAGNYSIEYTSDSSWSWTTSSLTENAVWQRTNSISAGNTYVFVERNTNNALSAGDDTALARGTVTKSGNSSTLTGPVDEKLQWIYRNNKLQNADARYYLVLSRNSASMNYMTDDQMTFSGNRIKVGSYYLRYNNGYTGTNSSYNATSFDAYLKTVNSCNLNFSIIAEAGVYNPGGENIAFEHHKRIDYLNDGVSNPDTNVQGEDMYRLYLDMTGKQEPIDLLIVVDESGSMGVNNDMTGSSSNMRRDDAVTEFLNGSLNGITDDGVLAYFLALNPENKVSIVEFHGADARNVDSHTVTNDVYPYSMDAKVLLNWTSQNQFVKCTAKTANGTNYEAGLQMATRQFSSVSNDGHRKLMIFLSDGVPTFFQISANDVGTQVDYDSGSYVIQRSDVGHRWGTGVGDAPNHISCKEPSKRAFDDFMDSNPGVLVFTVGISKDINAEDAGTSQSPDVLKYMAENGNGAFLSAADAMSNLKMNIESLFFPKGVTITDDLSKYVRYYGDQPDVLVTMKDKTTLQETVIYRNGAVTAAGRDIITDVVYTPADTAQNPTGSTGTIAAHFDPDYEFVPDYTYTLSFNVKTTETAYNKYAADGYDAVGDKGTDYGSNRTSSEKPGFYSNDKAEVSYKVTGSTLSEEYEMPVIQVKLRIRFIKTDAAKSRMLEGAVFALYGADASGNMLDQPITGLDHMVSGQNGVFSPEGLMLPLGTYYLKEIQAPNGCLKMEEPLKFTVETDHVTVFGDGVSTTASEVRPDTETADCKIFVKNSVGYELPETGGVGTVPLYTLGVLLMAGTIMCGCRLRRKYERRPV